jgi:hypothetical protein
MSATAAFLRTELQTFPRGGWRLKAVIAGIVVVIALIVWRSIPYVVQDANRPPAERIVAAFEKYKAANGRYPEKLDILVPSFLAKLPQPEIDTNFVYATSPDAKTAWIAYQNPRELLTEYDSRSQLWTDVDYGESMALAMPKKQFVKGPRSPS